MDRKVKGEALISEIFGSAPSEDRPAFREMAEIATGYLFGEIWSRPGLALRDRSLITVAILVATGKEQQLRTHLKGALANGLTLDELKEVMIHAAHYSGWPSCMNGLSVLQELADDDGLDFGP